ncbi:MAG: hypothetical protein Alis3KO_01140 [Aliiglaciecola sp.]
MGLEKHSYEDLGIDVEVEPLGAIFKFFWRGEPVYFGQCVVSTGVLQEAVIKGLSSPEMPPGDRRRLDKAIRRTLKKTNYNQGVFQRKRPDGKIVTVNKDLSKG